MSDSKPLSAEEIEALRHLVSDKVIGLTPQYRTSVRRLLATLDAVTRERDSFLSVAADIVRQGKRVGTYNEEHVATVDDPYPPGSAKSALFTLGHESGARIIRAVKAEKRADLLQARLDAERGVVGDWTPEGWSMRGHTHGRVTGWRKRVAGRVVAEVTPEALGVVRWDAANLSGEAPDFHAGIMAANAALTEKEPD